MVLKKSLINTVDYSYTYCAGILDLNHSWMFPSVGCRSRKWVELMATKAADTKEFQYILLIIPFIYLCTSVEIIPGRYSVWFRLKLFDT